MISIEDGRADHLARVLPHSQAGGGRRYQPQSDLFEAARNDPSLARSRATMWDVPRFAEFHEYEAVVVENVLETFGRSPLIVTTRFGFGVKGRVKSSIDPMQMQLAGCSHALVLPFLVNGP